MLEGGRSRGRRIEGWAKFWGLRWEQQGESRPAGQQPAVPALAVLPPGESLHLRSPRN